MDLLRVSYKNRVYTKLPFFTFRQGNFVSKIGTALNKGKKMLTANIGNVFWIGYIDIDEEIFTHVRRKLLKTKENFQESVIDVKLGTKPFPDLTGRKIA
jgi:hypothetical protein